MTHVTCRLTAKNRDQLRNTTTLGNRVWATFTFCPLCVCVCVLLGVSVAASLGVAAMFAVLSLIAACCIYARRQRVRRFVCRSCARLHSNYTYRQVALASSPRPFWGSWPPMVGGVAQW